MEQRHLVNHRINAQLNNGIGVSAKGREKKLLCSIAALGVYPNEDC